MRAVARVRWHIENTGFHQWTTRWHFGHVFTHNANAIRALFWLFFGAFNLLTLFLYCQLRRYGRDRGRNVNRTISRLGHEMLDELARLGSDTELSRRRTARTRAARTPLHRPARVGPRPRRRGTRSQRSHAGLTQRPLLLSPRRIRLTSEPGPALSATVHAELLRDDGFTRGTGT